MYNKRVFKIPIFSCEGKKVIGVTEDGLLKAAYKNVKWNLPELKQYDENNVVFDGENVEIYSTLNNKVIYKTDICEVESFFNKLEEKYTKDVWNTI